MTHASWLVQVYQMSDVAAQQHAAELLSSVGTLTVDVRTCDDGAFLVVDCSETADPLHVYELVMMVDSGAELIHSATGSSDVQTARGRLRHEGDAALLSDGDLLDA